MSCGSFDKKSAIIAIFPQVLHNISAKMLLINKKIMYYCYRNIGDNMKYLTTKDIAKAWGMSDRRVRMLCVENKIKGAKFENNMWLIPENAERPLRKNSNKKVGRAIDFSNLLKLKKQLENTRLLTESEVKRLNQNFLVNFTYNSNAIEGSTLTLNETDLVLQGITIDKKPLKEHLEAIGHKEAFHYILNLVREKSELTETIIKEIHSLVLMGQPQDRGVYRQIPVKITGSSAATTQPHLIREKIGELLCDLKEWKKDKNIIEQAALFHIRFETIHPFIDGNGRTGRLILNLMLMQNAYLPINIKFSDRIKYYSCFEEYHSNNSPNSMIELIKELEEEEIKSYLNIVG